MNPAVIIKAAGFWIADKGFGKRGIGAFVIGVQAGTVSADVSEDRRTLLIHALDVDDQDAMIRQIKQRYERPLKEIFEC